LENLAFQGFDMDMAFFKVNGPALPKETGIEGFVFFFTPKVFVLNRVPSKQLPS